MGLLTQQNRTNTANEVPIENQATKIEIKYLGYLATLEKNSPINPTKRLLF